MISPVVSEVSIFRRRFHILQFEIPSAISWLILSFYKKIRNNPHRKRVLRSFLFDSYKIAYGGFMKGFKSKIGILRRNSIHPTALLNRLSLIWKNP